MGAALLQLFELLSQFRDLALKLLFRPRIKHRTQITRATARKLVPAAQPRLVGLLNGRHAGTGQQVERVKLLAGMLQQTLQVAQTERVLERAINPVIPDRPELARQDESSGLDR